MSQGSKYCQECGKMTPLTAKFCEVCGKEFQSQNTHPPLSDVSVHTKISTQVENEKENQQPIPPESELLSNTNSMPPLGGLPLLLKAWLLLMIVSGFVVTYLSLNTAVSIKNSSDAFGFYLSATYGIMSIVAAIMVWKRNKVGIWLYGIGLLLGVSGSFEVALLTPNGLGSFFLFFIAANVYFNIFLHLCRKAGIILAPAVTVNQVSSNKWRLYNNKRGAMIFWGIMAFIVLIGYIFSRP